ncbi:MAG: hypothetical protein HPY81_04835 [Firmicutes bacterium]|nr:hypothetical protein [Bacillota bacterium]
MAPKMTLIHLLLQGIPETMGITAVALAFANLQLNWRIIIAVGVIEGLTIYLIRLLPIPFGFHTILLMITLPVFIKVATRQPFSSVLIRAGAIAVVIMAAVELLVIWPLFKLLNLSVEEANANTALWIITGWPQVVVLFGVAWLKDRHRRKCQSVGL